ncbi:MAG TPA: zinc-ribbon domain-containing protein [Candidatus Acidoferrales bacterium]
MSSELIPGKPGAGGSVQQDARPVAPSPTPVTSSATATPPAALKPAPDPIAAKTLSVAPSTAAQPSIPAPSKIPWSTTDSAAPAPAPTYKCPKCGTNARDVARFCPKCHATLRFECPSCHNAQRVGGKCEKCGIDFLKYIGAVVAAKQAEADMIHDRIESRSNLLKGILWLPLNGGLSLIKHFFGRD